MKSLILVFVLFLSFAPAAFADNGGYAVKFNGTDGYAVATMNSGNTNSTMTMEFWFSPVASQVGTQYLADLHSISGTNNRRVMPYLNNGTIGIYCAPNTDNDNNAITQSSGITASPNVWYHVAVTINSSTLKMYVNGKLYVTTSLTDAYALTGTEVLTLATDYGNTTYANIKMDEARIWSSERTEAQIKGTMYRELAGSEAGLLSYYKMSNGSGAALADDQIAGTYGGVLSGGYTWVASGAFADNRNGLDFDGSNDYVDCGNNASVQRNGTQPFTVEAWVKPTGGVWVAAVSKFVHTSSNEGYSLEIFSDNKVSLLYGNNWSDWNATTSDTALTSGVWSHIAATYDGSTVNIYVNGNLSQSANWTGGVTDSGTPLLIGSRSGTTFFSGQIDEVRVWTIARTAAQLRESMAKTLAGNEAGLAAYYRLDELDGNTVYDLSSNANNGTLTNMDAATDRVASGAFTTWIGADSTSWSDAGNWSKGAVPAATSNVGIYKWALGNEAAISGSPTTGNLLISSTAAPTLSSALTVNGNLILEKNLDLSGQAITLGSTSFLVEGSGRVFGTSGTIATTRTLSNIFAQNVAGLGAKITTVANLGSTTITRGHAQQTGAGNVSILRYYDISPTNNSSLNASLVFNYHDAELNSLTENNFRLYRSTDGGVNWTDQGGTLSAVNNTVTKTGIAAFSRWTLGDSTLSLSKTTPTITFSAAPTPTYLGGNFTVSASTTNSDSSTLTYSYVSGPCAWVSGATFSSTGAGTCVVQASGAATSGFYAASNTQSIVIAKANAIVTLSNLNLTYAGFAIPATASTTPIG
ncbi:MAG: LamG domain-containing protein, partial [Pelobacteraceae bacterium]